MFERFTKDARATVTEAVAHAERTGADTVTEEHLLLALLDRDGGRAAFAITALGLADRRDSVTAALADVRRRGGMTRADSEALADIGIDVTAVVARIEEAHGEGALRGDRGARRRWSGGPSYSRSAKKILEKSLRVALGRADRTIGAEHLLLALAATPGPVAEVLADHGTAYGAVERALFGAGGGTEGHRKAG
ncbi:MULTISPECIES: Clp protease N-terminal domain-containing protein [unclassified Streptomyces]|uniref:Clp protease N-terminal domain-containing protein n=1 Tax=unclassified Streptomyces TaxID=2593676 RepID=UPI000DAC51CA|nr:MULTISPECIES: Clp protease N-terminal domain-containing protein [unclassified Streptomyces]PZT76608.1 peptidase [Streptomyces sp. AC1-42W]PZT79435.1 peptidase [Streptomyces sp. AC1-42T]